MDTGRNRPQPAEPDVCWLCTHSIEAGPFCGSCGCLAHYRRHCHVRGCVRHFEGMHVDSREDAIVHVGCAGCPA